MAKSIKGKEVNIEGLRIKNQYATAIGNARLNARGDLLGKNGKIVKTREQLAQEYNTKNTNAAKNVPISQNVAKAMKAEDDKIAAGNAEHAKRSKKAKEETTKE